MRAAAAHVASDVERVLRGGTERGGEPWPVPSPLQDELPLVEVMREELLPRPFRSLVVELADRMQVPMDYPAVVAILCLAGVVGRRALMQPKANDTGWTVVPNLWGGIVAAPGFLKSPTIQAVTRPLLQIQEGWRQEHEAAIQKYQCEKEKFELRYAAWKEQYKASQKNGRTAPQRPEGEPEEPKAPRLILNDATFEAMHQTMSDNLGGVLVVRDEFTGWFAQLDRQGRELERAFCLQAWNGSDPFTVDRIGRGTVHVVACCLSMLGGIQPARLRSYLNEALRDGPGNDGLVQRFQLLVYPDPPQSWSYIDRPPAADIEASVRRVFERLVSQDAKNPKRYLFADDAQQLFIAWLTELEGKVRGEELHPALISHLSKYRSLMPTLALLFELADSSGGAETVSLLNARLAAGWCDYLESHARRIYSSATSPQLRAARDLAIKIKKRKIAADGFFSCRDVYLKGWSGLDTPEAVRQAAEVLEDAAWIRALDSGPGPFGGRPAERYEVNPGVWQ